MASMLSPKSKIRLEASKERAWVRWKWFTRFSEREWGGLGGRKEREGSE